VIKNQFLDMPYGMLPFQGETVAGTLNPTRWVGLAYLALSGQKKT
jgi:hypothetical protein